MYVCMYVCMCVCVCVYVCVCVCVNKQRYFLIGSHILKTTGSQRLRRVNITMDRGSQRKYIFVTELKEDGRGRYATYSPSLAISGSGNNDIAINVSAEISRYRGSRIHVNLTNIFKEPLTFTGK